MQLMHLPYVQSLTSNLEESLLVASSMVSLSGSIRETDVNKAVWNHRFNLFTCSSGLSYTYIDQVPENLLTMYLDPITVTANLRRHTMTPNPWHPDTTMLPLFCILVQDTHTSSFQNHKTSVKYIIPTACSHETYTVKFASKHSPGLC